jgi:aldose 1-epimerase
MHLSGTRFDLSAHGYTASIASVGATLRTLAFEGRDLVVGFDADEVRPAYRGATLTPWPNRVVDGLWSLDGVEQQLSLTEPPRHHALHGLAAWLDFTAESVEEHRVELIAVIEAQAGWPAPIGVTVTYELTADGLRWSVGAENLGDVTVPYGAGPHPYLVAGPGRVDDWTLELPAEQVLEVDAERLIPQGLAAVAGTEFDFREARGIGDTFIDHAYTAVTRAEARVTTATGEGVGMRWDSASPWVQVHTADRPIEALDRLGLAVEPMTCPPDAFNSGTDLVWLEPGATHEVAWEIFAI